MRAELLPAALAAGGGSAGLAAIYLRERRREVGLRASRRAFALTFPFGTEPEAAVSAVSGCAGLRSSVELVAEVRADVDGVVHVLHTPKPVIHAVRCALIGAVPSLRLREAGPCDSSCASLALVIQVRRAVALRTGDLEVSGRVLLGALGGLRGGERVVVRWALRSWHPPTLRRPPSRASGSVLFERAWRARVAESGFLVSGMVLIQAASAVRARELAEQIEAWVRGRHSQGAPMRVIRDRSGRRLDVLPRTSRRSGWLTARETAALLAWPVGDEVAPGVVIGAARELAVGRQVGRYGRRLFIGHDAGGERPVALDPGAARHHVAVVGPSGVGKSVQLARGVLDDLSRGHGGAVLDPKADLIDTILDRVPAEHADRVVVLDPAAEGPPVGVNVLSGGDPDLRADVLTGALSAIFGDAWGVRSEQYGRMAIRTLSELPGATLADAGRLFTDVSFRRAAVGRLRDPLLIATWQGYEALSAAEQAQHIQAPMARLMTLLGRPAVRAVLAQPNPRLDIARLLEQRKWLLISLAPGKIGEPAARLMGALLLYVIWSAVEGRVALAPARRHPVFLYVDELATLSALPFGFELLAERARGLGVGLTVAVQSLGRLPEATRHALLGNVATLITYRAGADEATRLARELPGLTARDLQALGRFEIAARVGTGAGSAVSVMTGRTEALPAQTFQAARIRASSVSRYGRTMKDSALSDTSHSEHPYPGPAAVGRTRRQP